MAQTVINEDGYAIYRRKDKKVTANKHVVPYNRHGKSLREFLNLSQPDPRLLKNLDNRLIKEALAFDMNKIKTIIARLRLARMIVLVVASSRITLLLLLGGRTPHSRLVISLELMENSTCGIKQNTHLAEPMQEVKLIIWDEAPMAQRYAFEALDKTEIY
nr:ATP-dependent DNA helicase PIF1-like [Tanacetum cinerariifolium]